MNIRNWVAVGSAIGGITITSLAAMVGYALRDGGEPSAIFVTGLVAVLLLGVTAACMLVGAGVAHHLDQRGDRYIEGVQKTVDRLAEALPGSAVRRIG